MTVSLKEFSKPLDKKPVAYPKVVEPQPESIRVGIQLQREAVQEARR